jgi:hypothetical protein
MPPCKPPPSRPPMPSDESAGLNSSINETGVHPHNGSVANSSNANNGGAGNNNNMNSSGNSNGTIPSVPKSNSSHNIAAPSSRQTKAVRNPPPPPHPPPSPRGLFSATILYFWGKLLDWNDWDRAIVSILDFHRDF